MAFLANVYNSQPHSHAMYKERPSTSSQNIILILNFTIMVVCPNSTKGNPLIFLINGITEPIVSKPAIVSVIVIDSLPSLCHQFFQCLFV